MTKSKFLILISTVLISFSAAAAPPLEPADFAYGIPLNADPGNSVNRIMIPEAVYKGVTRADLSDVRVFNAAGEVAPSAVDRRPTIPTIIDLAVVPLPIFSLTRESASNVPLSVEVTANGTLTRVMTTSNDALTETVAAYVLDASAIPTAIRGMVMEWDEAAPTFAGEISVMSSSDLHVWAPVSGSVTIADMRHGADRVRQNAVYFPAVKAQYFRITWPGERPPVEITSVNAVPERQNVAQPPRWSEAAFIPAPPGETGLIFDAGGFLPAETVKIALPEPGLLADVTIASSNLPEGPWTTRSEGRIYRLKTDGKEIEDTGFAVMTTDRYWKLTPTNVETGLSGITPALHIAWHPQELFFVARGENPFTLAYGSVMAKGSDVDMTGLQANIIGTALQILDAGVGEPVILGGPSKLSPPIPPPPYKKWFLWGVLASGVVVLAMMARSLLKEAK